MKVLRLFLVLAASTTFALANPNVKITGVTKSFDAKTNTLTYKVTLENTGDMDATGYRVTAQPYNSKPADAAAKKTQNNVTVPAGGTTMVTFTFTGADGKDWKWQYTDVYKGPNDCTDKVHGSIGPWYEPKKEQRAGEEGTFEFQFPYPDTAYACLGGAPAAFHIEVVEESLPPGWSVSFNPPPGTPFTLAAGEVQDVIVTIRTAQGPYQLGTVTFDFVQPTTGIRRRSVAPVICIDCIPTLSEWAAILMTMALAGAGTWLIGKR